MAHTTAYRLRIEVEITQHSSVLLGHPGVLYGFLGTLRTLKSSTAHTSRDLSTAKEDQDFPFGSRILRK